MEGRSADKLQLAIDNAHERDSHITFEEISHTYRVDGKAVAVSVTGLISRVESEHFDAPRIAAQLAASQRPSERYSRFDEALQRRVALPASEILALWDLARDLGTDLHGKIERALNGLPVHFEDGKGEDDGEGEGESESEGKSKGGNVGVPNRKEFDQFQRWWGDQQAAGYEAYRTEWVIYDGPLLAGSIDFLMRNTKTGDLSIVDWKRCLTSGSGFSSAWKNKKMLPPLQHLEETKLNHWKVQVNVYRAILERHYRVKIAEMMMVVLYADQHEAVVYKHDRDDLVERLIATLGRGDNSVLETVI